MIITVVQLIEQFLCIQLYYRAFALHQLTCFQDNPMKQEILLFPSHRGNHLRSVWLHSACGDSWTVPALNLSILRVEMKHSGSLHDYCQIEIRHTKKSAYCRGFVLKVSSDHDSLPTFIPFIPFSLKIKSSPN